MAGFHLSVLFSLTFQVFLLIIGLLFRKYSQRQKTSRQDRGNGAQSSGSYSQSQFIYVIEKLTLKI